MRKMLPETLILATIVLLSGCRIGVSIFTGGDVLSASGERNCFEGTSCEFAVDDTLFTETFTAKPRNGYVFTRWRDGEGFLCGNSTNPECTVNLVGDSLADLVVASDVMGYLVPEFTCTGICPERFVGNIRGLDEALVALEEAKDAIAAYVSSNGGQGAPNPDLYGVELGTTGSTMLRDIDIYPTDASSGLHNFYIVANVFRRVWGDTDNPWQTSSFALSGQTNADNSITWLCVPGDPGLGEPDSIPVAWLPLFCRV